MISALIKSTGLRTDGPIDTRSFWINYVSPLSISLAISWVHPRLIAIHELNTKVGVIHWQVFTVNSFLIQFYIYFPFLFLTFHFLSLNLQENDESLIPPPIPLSSEYINDNGIYLLENGEDCLIYVGNSADPGVMHQLLGISSVEQVPAQVIWTFPT